MAQAHRPDSPDESNGGPPEKKPVVVGIGASAGGLTALRALFATVPPDSGLVFVVVVHLAPDSESYLAELLQRGASIPISQVIDDVLIVPNQVYVIPPGRNLSVIDSHLRLSKLEPNRRDRAPIDNFLITLGETHDGSSVAVILSGTGSDGAHGIQYVRQAGGMTIVQDPEEAEYDGMPRQAMATGLVDMVLPVAAIVPAIMEFARTHPRLPDAMVNQEPDPDKQLEKILALVHQRTGHDFSRYKRSSITRRVGRRMQILNIEKVGVYLDSVHERPDEVIALLDDLLINVTSFFRDPAVFAALETDIVPKLFDGKGPNDRVRVWSVGCATGEEAYSIAMLLHEEARRHTNPPSIQVFGSDLHERSLLVAREGVYPDAIEAHITPERLERFFTKEGGVYRVRKTLRDSLVFATHNLLRDPPFSRMDLIICRNVLIYLQRDVQRDVIEIFHYALRNDGYLLLGTAESLDQSDRFRVEDSQQHLYRRRQGPRADLRLRDLSPAASPILALPSLQARADGHPYGVIHQRAVEQYAPPSVLVGPTHEIVHMSENAGRFLQHSGGVPSTNIFRLVRNELRAELHAVLLAATDGAGAARSRPIAVEIDGQTRYVVLRAAASNDQQLDGFVLVIFDEADTPNAPQLNDARDGNSTAAELETELALTKSRLNLVIEELERGQQEMRASNEELQSSNEELRSTMEELETSREELQSVNEELHTVNQENKHKVEELSQLSNDLQNLLDSTNVATLFLDRQFRIVRFTPPIVDIFNVRHTDRGRPLGDLTHRLGYPGLLQDAKRVLQSLVPVEKEVGASDGRWHLVRVTPYRTAEDHIEGVVITFVDVSSLKRTEAALRESEERFRIMADSSGVMIWVRDQDGNCRFVNSAFAQFYGVSAHGVTFEQWKGLLHPDEVAKYSALHQNAIASRTGFQTEVRVRRADGEWRWIESFSAPRFDASGALLGTTGSDIDITKRHQREAHIELLIAIDKDLVALASSESIINAVGARLTRHFAAAGVVFGMLNDTGAMSVSLFESNPNGTARVDASEIVDRASLIAPEQVNDVVVIDDVAVDPRLSAVKDAYARRNVRSQLAAYFSSAGEQTFVIVVERAKPHHWSGDEIEVVREIAVRLFTRLQRVHAEEALRASETRYRSLLGNVRGHAIFILDAQGAVAEWIAGAEDVMGYTTEDVLGEHVSMFYTLDAVAAGEPQAELREAAELGRAERESWRVRKDGSRFWAIETVSAIYDAHGSLVGYTKITRDRSDYRELAEAARNANRVQLSMAEEAERRRLARELHDEAGQHLAAISLGLQSLSDIVQPESEVDRRAAALRALTDTLGREIHAFAVRLRPRVLDDFGLEAALKSYAYEWSRLYDIAVDVQAEEVAERLPEPIETAIYRIAQEALTNVARHSGAARASVLVERRDRYVHAVIEDDGVGFDGLALDEPSARVAGLGLRGMYERATLLGGSLEVESKPGAGTAILIRIPVGTKS